MRANNAFAENQECPLYAPSTLLLGDGFPANAGGKIGDAGKIRHRSR
jgi:hypothetical protein